jgi:hypothetical protein
MVCSSQRSELRCQGSGLLALLSPGLSSPGPQYAFFHFIFYFPLIFLKSADHHPLLRHPNIQLTKRPKRMASPSSICRSAWAPLRREMTDWQPGSRDRSAPEPVMWSAWQWVFTGRERTGPRGQRLSVASHPGARSLPLLPQTQGSRPQLSSLRPMGPGPSPFPQTQGSRPPALLSQTRGPHSSLLPQSQGFRHQPSSLRSRGPGPNLPPSDPGVLAPFLRLRGSAPSLLPQSHGSRPPASHSAFLGAPPPSRPSLLPRPTSIQQPQPQLFH